MSIEIGDKVKFIKNTVGEYSPVQIGSVGEIIYQIDDDYEVLFECGYYGFYHTSELEIAE